MQKVIPDPHACPSPPLTLTTPPTLLAVYLVAYMKYILVSDFAVPARILHKLLNQEKGRKYNALVEKTNYGERA
jgi:hypothetical protein